MNALGCRLRELFKSTSADAVFLKTSERLEDSAVSYFTGLPRQLLPNNVLILRPGRKPVLVKSILEPKVSVPGIRVLRIDRKKQFEKALKNELKGVKTLGLNRHLHTTYSLKALKKTAGKKKLVDVSKKIASMRAVKSREELFQISKACGIAQSVSEEIPDLFRKGMTEQELAMRIEVLLREKGENILPFPVIVASGKNAAFPHHVPSRRRIGKGLLLLDFGAYSKNYCSDITRMFSVGKPAQKHRELYASVFGAKQFAQSITVPGAVAGDVFKQADALLKKETGLKLVHGLGHGLGVDAHDFPQGFVPESREKLKQNMVLTVEPAVYGKFGGIRIEDDIVVTARGCRQLTRAPAELIRLC